MRNHIIILFAMITMTASSHQGVNLLYQRPCADKISQTHLFAESPDFSLAGFSLSDLLEDVNIGDLSIGKLLSLTKLYSELRDDKSLSHATDKFVKTLKTHNSKKIKKAGKTFRKRITKSCNRYFKRLAKDARTAEKNLDYRDACEKYKTINEMYDALRILLPDLKNYYQEKLSEMKKKTS